MYFIYIYKNNFNNQVSVLKIDILPNLKFPRDFTDHKMNLCLSPMKSTETDNLQWMSAVKLSRDTKTSTRSIQ